MNSIINKSIYVLCLLCGLCVSCQEDDDTSLSAVTDLSYEPTMGGAVISFKAPANNDLLYIKAAYTNSLGEDVYRTTSIYDNKIEIDGLADETKSYPVHVSAVDKWGGETSATTISVTPGRSYINIIKDNLELHPMCGGLAILWNNPMGIESQDEITAKNPGKAVYVVVDYTDESGITRTRYLTSKLREAKARVRGLMAGNYKVTFHVEDFAGNKTAQSTSLTLLVPAETEFPKFIEVEDEKAGTVKVSWSKTAKASAGYLVVVRYSKDGPTVAKQTVAAGKTKATFTGLKPGKTSWVLVRALRSAGGATYSGILTRAKPVKVAGKAAKAQSTESQAQPQAAGSGLVAAAL